MAAGDPMGERVTVAILGERLSTAIDMIKAQTETIRALTTKMDDWNKCQGDINSRMAAVETLQTTHTEEIRALRAKDTSGNIITGAMAFIAGLLGVFFKP
ncbi:MAG: hypothetical protein WC710_14075 [Gallionella sp.]|jgi:hypothetical protein